MKLAILETGRPPGQLADEFGAYPAMFEATAGPGFEIETFDVQAGEFPEPRRITSIPRHWFAGRGLRSAAMDRAAAGVHPRCQDRRRWSASASATRRWRRRLAAMSRSRKRAGAPGSTATTSSGSEPWMDGADAIADPASHQDQVVVQPPNTEIVATSDFTPFAGTGMDRPPGNLLPIPSGILPGIRQGADREAPRRVPNPDAAIASLDAPNDNARVGGWIRRFLEA